MAAQRTVDFMFLSCANSLNWVRMAKETDKTTPEQDDLGSILEGINKKIEDGSGDEKITMGELLGLMHTKGISLCILILSLPSCFPGMFPPMPTIMAIPMILFAWQLVLRRHSIYLPKFLANMKVGRKSMAKIIRNFIYYLNKLPSWKEEKPFIPSDAMEMAIGITVIIFAAMMFIPIPFTNMFPSAGAGLIMIGMLKQSKLYALIGLAVGMVGMVVSIFTLIGVVWLAT
jgi:hypothetical protein